MNTAQQQSLSYLGTSHRHRGAGRMRFSFSCLYLNDLDKLLPSLSLSLLSYGLVPGTPISSWRRRKPRSDFCTVWGTKRMVRRGPRCVGNRVSSPGRPQERHLADRCFREITLGFLSGPLRNLVFFLQGNGPSDSGSGSWLSSSRLLFLLVIFTCSPAPYPLHTFTRLSSQTALWDLNHQVR